MNAVQRRTIYSFVFVSLLLLPFQNCSQTQFSSSGNESKKKSPQFSGGEGYGGKLYELVSQTDPCSDPNLPVSQIESDISAQMFLTAKNCQSLVAPQPITVDYFPGLPSVIGYNGQTYRDENSSAPFTPNAVLDQVIEAENFDDQPTGGGGVSGGILTINDNEAVENDNTNFSVSGRYVFTIRAGGDVGFGVGSIFQFEIDGVVIGQAETSEVLADFTFEANVTAGIHEVSIRFINDNGNGVPSEDRNLDVDRLTILRRVP